MSFPTTLKTLATSKAVAVGAGTALVAAGLAVASPQVVQFEQATDSAVEAVDDEPIAEVDEDDEVVIDEPVDDAAEGDDEVTDPDEGDEVTDVEDRATDEGDDVDESDDVEEGDDVEEPAEVERGAAEDDDATDDEADGRSQRAKDVHRALTATDENPEGLSPGDPGFGQAVASNARERGGNGRAVSEAARGDRGGNGNGRGNGGGNGKSGDDDVIDRPVERESSPSGDDASGPGDARGNRPDHAGGPKG